MISLACIIGAAVVASTGNDGWGWLIFAAVLLADSKVN